MDSPWFLRFTALFLAIILFFLRTSGRRKSNSTSGWEMQWMSFSDVPCRSIIMTMKILL